MRRYLPLAALLAASPSHAAEPVAVPVLAHMVERGAVLSAADFEAQPRSPGMAAGALAAEAASGRELVRTLPAGAVVRAGDIVAVRLVRRGEPVTVTLRSGGLAIATGGRALSAGGMGDLVRVVTASTNRTLDGVVEGSGRVRIAAH